MSDQILIARIVSLEEELENTKTKLKESRNKKAWLNKQVFGPFKSFWGWWWACEWRILFSTVWALIIVMILSLVWGLADSLLISFMYLLGLFISPMIGVKTRE